MADKTSVQIHVRCGEGLPAALDALADERGVSRNQLIVGELERVISPPSKRGTTADVVPPSGATSGLPVPQLSTSELACLDQLAARAGVGRVELMARFLRERLRREFIEDRQRLMAEAKPRPRRAAAASAQENGH